MDIKRAKEQIKYAIKSYFTKDERGNFIIPTERQRPIFLMGPPGIGKTAIMEQIAGELGVGIVTYSMTHHTRQSALGLPFIVKKTFDGEEYSVSEYTMSEIIATVYDRIERYGAREGILFLDEINCVSETLAPSMLQFLQYKIFGTHRVPDGWIVVTAGNPPEYNNSVREFDIVTWDRLKRIDVEPDYPVWREYALSCGVHPAITTYLDIKKTDFYNVESTVDGKRFVTARGWVDLSDMIKLYEINGFPVDSSLVIQYLQDPNIARNFAVYYDLFMKYRSDYQVETIVEGEASEEIVARAAAAKFDERISVLGLIYDRMSSDLREVSELEDRLTIFTESVKRIRSSLVPAKRSGSSDILREEGKALKKKADMEKKAGMISDEQYNVKCDVADEFLRMSEEIDTGDNVKLTDPFEYVKKEFGVMTDELKTTSKNTADHFNNALLFCEKAFGVGSEITMLVTQMTSDHRCAVFISRYGCEQYFRFNKELLIGERQLELANEISRLDLD